MVVAPPFVTLTNKGSSGGPFPGGREYSGGPKGGRLQVMPIPVEGWIRIRVFDTCLYRKGTRLTRYVLIESRVVLGLLSATSPENSR